MDRDSFPGDMLFKNFGVTRLGRVVFYDYDEIQTMTEMNFRRIPPASNEEVELDADYWQAARARNRRGRLDDIFPYDTARRFARTVRGAGPAREVSPS